MLTSRCDFLSVLRAACTSTTVYKIVSIKSCPHIFMNGPPALILSLLILLLISLVQMRLLCRVTVDLSFNLVVLISSSSFADDEMLISNEEYEVEFLSNLSARRISF